MRFGDSRGSALVLVVFVLALLGGMGLSLLALSQSEVRMGKAGLQNERAFFLAEAALENGRATMLELNGTPDAGPELAAAAGPNGVFDFDPTKVRVVYDADGKAIGFEGYGDDMPLRAPTRLGGGLFAAFLANDPDEAGNADPRLDENEQFVVFGVGTGEGGALEIVQGLVEPEPLLPSIPPCTIMLLGPTPDFDPGRGVCEDPLPDDEDEDEDTDEIDDEITDLSRDDDSSDDDLFDDSFFSPGLDDEFADEDEDEDEDEDVDDPSNASKTFWGTDCAGDGGIDGHYVPVVCVQGCATPPTDDEDEDEDADEGFDPIPGGTSDAFGDEDEDEDPDLPPVCADTIVEAAIDIDCPNDFISGPYTGADTIADLNDPLGEPTMGPGFELDPGWTDCGRLFEMLAEARELSDFSCSGGCHMDGAGLWAGGLAPTDLAESSLTFVDGDLNVPPGFHGEGLLFVTGTLNFDASASWNGPMIVVGEGRFVRTGIGGDGLLSGATVVINIAGDDGSLGTADDCADGLGVATYYEAERETGDTQYCTDDLLPANPVSTYGVAEFRQH